MQNNSFNKIFINPFSRILLGLLVCFAVFIIAQNLMGTLLALTGLDKDYRNLFKGLIASAFVLCAYNIFYKFMEKRKVLEMSTYNIAKNLALGVLMGVALQCLTVLVIYLNDGFTIISVNPASFMIIPLTVAFTVAIFEEILIRGILFRIIEEKLGSYMALIISAVIFGGLHLINSGTSFISASCVAVEGGLLLGATYIYSRSLWLPIALHFAWNFMQSGILGAVTSGNEKTNSLFTTQITGSQKFTGGAFGPEGTIQATILCFTAAMVFMYMNKKDGKLIKPYWKNKPACINANKIDNKWKTAI